ncbi:MAG: 4'-phosphopantetheinyl transferase superfamily protein [Bacilli bacterium]|nr:4'-phosphopantetheinyl transferase superfamily protein [Bacilli bacterium]
MIKANNYSIFIGNISELEKNSLDLLGKTRKNKANLIKNENEKKLSILAGVLLYNALGKEADEVKYDANGKPYLESGKYLSISHSGSKAVVVTSSFPIGVDIQEMKEPDYKICKQFFSKEESNINDKVDFYKAWTSKEAYMKASGVSLNEALKENIHKVDGYQIIKSEIIEDNYYLSIVIRTV